MNDKNESTPAVPQLHVASSPHFGTTGRSTRWMMYDVVLALLPALAVSIYVFGMNSVRVTAISVISCIVTELVFQLIRRRPVRITDGSALITGLILAMSLPWTSPWYVACVGGAVAIGIGKMVFGGLGANIFNPAMVGRAFVMICFAACFSAYHFNGEVPANVSQSAFAGEDVIVTTSATPMEAGKKETATLEDGQAVKVAFSLKNLLAGNINGSLGETSAIALILGGIYLCVRRTICWRIPAGAIIALLAIATVNRYCGNGVLGPLHHLFGGAFLIGAFFIATDPVTSPVSQRGRWIYGIAFGSLCMVIRLFSSYPEGVMFAVLLVNAVTPIINRWTIPRPLGGRPAAVKA